MAGPVIALLTDFGSRDTYVAEVKGAILTINPAATLVDITHEVPPQDINAGGFLLANAVSAFPPGTVYVAVVDPGVGTARRPLIVETNASRKLPWPRQWTSQPRYMGRRA